jgi:endonuclease-3
MTPKEKYEIVYEVLSKEYGEPTWRQHLPPVDELVSTILSQNTSDINRDKAFYALKDRFPDWQSVIEAPVDDIRETIRPAGLANQKAPRIQNALKIVKGHNGQLNLDFLEEMTVDEALEWLMAIKGVGRKTASIILLFAYGRPAFPVDTHVHRVTSRLGLIGPKISADKAHTILEQMGSPEGYYAFHLNLIRHGREVCAARKPDCEKCPLTAYCDYFRVITHG